MCHKAARRAVSVMNPVILYTRKPAPAASPLLGNSCALAARGGAVSENAVAFSI